MQTLPLDCEKLFLSVCDGMPITTIKFLLRNINAVDQSKVFGFDVSANLLGHRCWRYGISHTSFQKIFAFLTRILLKCLFDHSYPVTVKQPLTLPSPFQFFEDKAISLTVTS